MTNNPYLPAFAGGVNFMGNGAFGGQVAGQLAPGYTNLLTYSPNSNQIANVNETKAPYQGVPGFPSGNVGVPFTTPVETQLQLRLRNDSDTDKQILLFDSAGLNEKILTCGACTGFVSLKSPDTEVSIVVGSESCNLYEETVNMLCSRGYVALGVRVISKDCDAAGQCSILDELDLEILHSNLSRQMSRYPKYVASFYSEFQQNPNVATVPLEGAEQILENNTGWLVKLPANSKVSFTIFLGLRRA